MDLDSITVSDFKSFFRRDFPYAPANADECGSLDEYVFDEDISKAFLEAQAVFNQSLFGSDANIRLAYYYISAHYLSVDLRTAMQGIESTGNFPLQARTVGNVSETYNIPARYLNDPLLAYFTSTGYGMKYLSLLIPNLVGNIGVVCGWTNP